MANPEHLKILGEGVEAWNKWRLEHVFRPELSEANLRKADLGGAKLTEADLSEANLAALNAWRMTLISSESVLLPAYWQIDLREADLHGRYLRGANFQAVKMSGANLVGADLSLANLDSANLVRANLTGVSLFGANMSQTNLTEASLSGAALLGCNFTRARLEKTNMTDAILLTTVFASTSLNTTIGLETCKHEGRSILDYDTLMRGPMLEAFLRGCGLSEELIRWLPSFWNRPFEFYSCFISYSHTDKSFARRLHDALQGRGIRCWLDEKQLLPGDHIHREVDEAVRLWDKVLLCCSKASLASWWVDKEISKALKKEEQLWKERGKQVLAIIPLNLDSYMFDPQWQDWKKQHLTDRLSADFTGWEKDNGKFEEQLERVVKALRADANAREQPPKSRL